MNKTVLGIGGYIGAGKTVAGRFFESMGAYYIDADEVVNDLYKKGEDGYRKIVDYFGDDFLMDDGELDRSKIAKFVFGDAKKLEILNNLIHPLVASRIQKMIDASDVSLVAIEAAYFNPKGLGKLADKILWIKSKKELMAERILNRPGMNEELFENILLLQIKPDHIDYIIENNGTIEDFEIGLMEVRVRL